MWSLHGGGRKVYINGQGHITKIAVMSMYGREKNPSNIFFSRTKSLMILKIGKHYAALGTQSLHLAYINDDPELTFTYFMVRSNLVACAFELHLAYINDDPELTFTYFMVRSKLVACAFE